MEIELDIFTALPIGSMLGLVYIGVLEMKPGQKYGSLILGEDGKFHKDPNCKSFGGKGKKRPSAGAKISKAIKGSHIYNNGIINKRAFECPEGFVPGKLKK